MKSKLIEHKWFQAGLGIAVLLIWGYNMTKIADISLSDSVENGAVQQKLDPELLSIPPKDPYVYEADFRDPFKPALTKRVPRPSPEPEPKKAAPPVRLPVLSLSGVIEGTAMIHSKGDNTVYFVAPGDTVAGARVVSVEPDSVVMVYKEKEFVVKL